MKTTVGRLICLILLALAAECGWAGGHSHQGEQHGDKQKKDSPVEQTPSSEAFDPTAVNEEATHTAKGAIRRVVANDSSDAKQIGLIRANLKAAVEKLGPATFTGLGAGRQPTTPALIALRNAGPGQLVAQYLEIRAGAEIRYSSDDAELVKALQDWLDAQTANRAADVGMRRGVPMPRAN